MFLIGMETSPCEVLPALFNNVSRHCFISKNKLGLYLQCMVKHLLSMQSGGEISLRKLFWHSYLSIIYFRFMCNVLSKAHFSKVHVFVSVQDEIVQHSGTIINSNVTL